MLLLRFLGKPGQEWFAGAFVLLAYELANPILGIFSEKWWIYTGLSILFFIGLIALIILSGVIISQKTLSEFGEDAMIYLVVIYYPVLIALCGAVRLGIFIQRG